MAIVQNVPPAFPGFGHKRKRRDKAPRPFQRSISSFGLLLFRTRTFLRAGKRGQILRGRTHVKEGAPLAVAFYPYGRVITSVWLHAGNFDFVSYQRSIVVKLQSFPIA